MKSQLWDLGFSHSPAVGAFYVMFSYLKGFRTQEVWGPSIIAANHFLMFTELLENEWISEDTPAPPSIFGKPCTPCVTEGGTMALCPASNVPQASLLENRGKYSGG